MTEQQPGALAADRREKLGGDGVTEPAEGNQCEARAACEHFYASHCYRGMSIRLCMTCHEPDWDDLAEQLAAASAVPSPPVAAIETTWTPEQIAEFRELFDAAMVSPGPLRVLPRDPVADAEHVEAAAAVLERRYPGTRPDALQDVLSELWAISRAWRRIAAEGASER